MHKYRRQLFVTLFILLCGIFSCGKNGTGPENERKPRLTNQPEVLNIQQNTVDITWETDYIANSTIKYGTQSGNYPFTRTEETKVKIHLITLRSLQPNTTYYFVVESQNAGGKITSSESQFKTEMTFNQLLQAAWPEYENGNYEKAIELFLTILQQNSEWADAYNGLGWCYASNEIDSLDKALENFNSALNFQAYLPGALAGRGFVNLALKKYTASINDLKKVVDLNANYVFEHNGKITANSIRLALAEAYYYRRNYSLAQLQVNVLAPNNGLNPGDSSTWLLNTSSYFSYEAALVAWIEHLKTVVG